MNTWHAHDTGFIHRVIRFLRGRLIDLEGLKVGKMQIYVCIFLDNISSCVRC